MNQSNYLTIAETRDYLCPEHAARVFVAECWWALVPSGDNHPLSFATTGDASPFWALVDAVQSMGEPLGFTKVQDHLGRTRSVPHNDPELLLRAIIKLTTTTQAPDREILRMRAEAMGVNPDKLIQHRLKQYEAELQAAEDATNQAIRTILAQRKAMTDEWEGTEGGEWMIPIDRIIEFGERQIQFLANNPKVNDQLFGAETMLWKDEIAKLSRIVQKRDAEGAGEGSRHIDEQLISGADMRAGISAGR